ncbi:hypothetical protein BDV96DRAFT_643721 [Lophiotrema nucula]|uniref:D-isomer specific 2-hydroxyacid dehydrogenase NAD-binding domain-containing protein n=1 Tax=Lophiotrema nucula TaxID=690887 RepID=A0A6A5ZGY1_9PLEO|nr:hypothetical protein BDV96DRAFT_643721 [Lophiotrema nucula]
MVAMGGGPEVPLREGGRSQSHELLLAVLPWPQTKPQKIINEIEAEFPNLEIEFVYEVYENKADRGKVEVPEELYKRAKILATLSWLPPSAASAPDLELIQFFSAGTNHVANHPIYTDSDIPLSTASGVHGPQIAEWVVMMRLVQAHNYTHLYEAQKSKNWGSVARVAKAMGSEVIAYTASPRPTPESRRDDGFIVPGTGDPEGEIPKEWFSGTSKEALHDFLGQGIDYLVVCVPLTKDTTHFLSTPEFELLQKSNPHGTYIANISRGAVIDQKALVKALESKQIPGALLDVTDPEPLPADDPLWTAPNVLITPHVSGSTTVYAERAFQVLQENLRRRRDGKKFVNQVDRKRGY